MAKKQSLVNFKLQVFLVGSLICNLILIISHNKMRSDIVFIESQISDLIELEKLRGSLRDLGLVKELNDILSD
tara:strand:+ start:306 stop:524 length:219 start_codon:yes stop_codon:yes gene_type:complete